VIVDCQVPQGLKPTSFVAMGGTTEVVPFPSLLGLEFFRSLCRSNPSQRD
jgi:hypothetical protein